MRLRHEQRAEAEAATSAALESRAARREDNFQEHVPDAASSSAVLQKKTQRGAFLKTPVASSGDGSVLGPVAGWVGAQSTPETRALA